MNKTSADFFESGNKHFEKHDFDRAILDFNEAIRLNPNNESAYLQRGAAYAITQNYGLAIKDFEAVLRINPNANAVRLALEDCKEELQQAEDGSPLHTAVSVGSVEFAKNLVSKGADVNAKNKDGYTPLSIAALNGNVDLINFLIAKNADINAKG